MSHAACRIPGTTYGLAIRTSERRFFLAPTDWTNLVLRFLLGFYALRHGIQLHGYAFLSNHYHLVLTDTRGVLGDFLRDLNSKLARILNFSLDRGEALFTREGYEAWELATEDVAAHLAYVAANPVAAGLVHDPAQWPGLTSLPEDFERAPRSVAQPEAGFFGRGPSAVYPKEVQLELTLPPGYDSRESFLTDFRFHLQAELEGARRDLGPGHVWKPKAAHQGQDPFAAPAGGTRPDFQVRPHLAKAASPERKAGLKAWREAYAHALYAWRCGVREVLFPPGTFLMRRLHRVKVAPLH